MTKRVRVWIYRGPDNKAARVPCCQRLIVADLVGPLAVHQGVAGCKHHVFGASRTPTWTITHIGTGHAAVQRLPSRAAALRLARELRGLSWSEILKPEDVDRWKDKKKALRVIKEAAA